MRPGAFKALCTLLSIPLLLCCTPTRESVDSTLYGSALVGLGSYLSYSETKELYQNSAINLHVPSDFYAEEITSEQLFALMGQVSFDRTFPTVMAYMGNRGGYEYYLFKPSFESRRIVKVKSKADAPRDVDTLSIDKHDWRYVRGPPPPAWLKLESLPLDVRPKANPGAASPSPSEKRD